MQCDLPRSIASRPPSATCINYSWRAADNVEQHDASIHSRAEIVKGRTKLNRELGVILDTAIDLNDEPFDWQINSHVLRQDLGVAT